MRAVIILCLLAVCVSVAQAAYWNIGCFTEYNQYNLRLPYLVYKGSDMTIRTCIDLCKHYKDDYIPHGYDYAGLEFGHSCYCGNNYPDGHPEDDDKCNLPCSGDASRQCGGDWKIDIYASKMGYRGCFENTYEDPVFPVQAASGYYYYYYYYLTRIDCVYACAGYKYAGVTNGYDCFCGNIAPKFPAKKDDECDINCPGNSYEKCGGYYRMNVFRITSK